MKIQKVILVGCTGRDYNNTKLCNDCDCQGTDEACHEILTMLNRIELFKIKDKDIVQEYIDSIE